VNLFRTISVWMMTIMTTTTMMEIIIWCGVADRPTLSYSWGILLGFLTLLPQGSASCGMQYIFRRWKLVKQFSFASLERNIVVKDRAVNCHGYQ
jgi:hypothetical protein